VCTFVHHLKQSKMTTQKMIAEFNKPYQTAVAINCDHIGDDNDYSCFLYRVIRELYKSGKKEMAYKLALTDPMLCGTISFGEFEEMQAESEIFEQDQKKCEAAMDDLMFRMG